MSPSALAFATVLALGAVLILVEMRGFSFFQDEWDFVVARRGLTLDNLLTPAGPHLSLVPIVIFKLLLRIFGAGSYTPWKVLTAFDAVLIAGTVGVMWRRRWGAWWGLVPAALLVTLGPGAHTLLWPYQVGYAMATVSGIVALLLVGRAGRHDDPVACALIVFSMLSASQGIGVLAGAAVIIALDHRRGQRAWVVLIPAVLYGLWYLKYGRMHSETHLSLWTHIPAYVAKAIAATFAALTGLSQANDQTVNASLGFPIALAVLAGIVIAVRRGWRPSPLFLGIAATLLVLWVAACLSNAAGNRPPESERYVPTDAALFLVAICAARSRPPPLGREIALAGLAAVSVICFVNASAFSNGRAVFALAGTSSRAQLGGLLIARGIVDPAFEMPHGPPAAFEGVYAKNYFSAVDSFGTNAFTPSELMRVDPSERLRVDGVIVSAERIALAADHPRDHPRTGGAGSPPAVLSGSGRVTGPCVRLTTSVATLRAPATGVQIDAPSNRSIRVGVVRFAATATALGGIPSGGGARLALPADHAPQVPWKLFVEGVGTSVCALS